MRRTVEFKGDQQFALILDFLMKFLRKASSYDPNLSETAKKNFNGRHINAELIVEQNSISIKSEITRLYLTAVQKKAEKMWPKTNSKVKLRFWTRIRKEIRDQSAQVGPFILKSHSVEKEHIKLMKVDYDKKNIPKISYVNWRRKLDISLTKSHLKKWKIPSSNHRTMRYVVEELNVLAEIFDWETTQDLHVNIN